MLTEKNEKFIELVLKGKSRVDAIMEVYGCKDKNSAYVINHKLKNNNEVKERLRKVKEITAEMVDIEAQKFIDILELKLPKSEVIDKLIELLRSDDKRVILGAIQEYNKLLGNYPDKSIGIYRDLKKEQDSIYLTEADIKEIPAAKEESKDIYTEQQ